MPSSSSIDIGPHAPALPVLAKDTVIVGAAFREGMTPKSMRNNKGYVRGFNVRTGKRLWIFHTIPSLGEFGNDTWEKDSWKYTGNAGVWGQMSIDEELGIVYLPIELPTGKVPNGIVTLEKRMLGPAAQLFIKEALIAARSVA